MNDSFILNILSKLCDFKTQCRILVERSFLKKLGGGCSAPVGINSIITEVPNSVEQEFSMTADGGVWSLDGKTEIVDKVSSNFTLEKKMSEGENDNEENSELDVSPSKRQKMSEEDTNKLKKSPQIIDESSLPSTGDKNASELINIHGKVFDVCPYSGKSKTDRKKADNDESESGCQTFDPIKLPIGQDFMGECPVLNTEQKITFESSVGGESICPIAGKSFSPPTVTSEEINKCPFLHKQMNQTVELIDYEEANAQKCPKTISKSLVDNATDVKLYCGFFCHNESLRPVFDKCEELGISLAKKLISAGALDVMKIAQDEIHSKC